MLAAAQSLPERLRGKTPPTSGLQPSSTQRAMGRLALGRCPTGRTWRWMDCGASAGPLALAPRPNVQGL